MNLLQPVDVLLVDPFQKMVDIRICFKSLVEKALANKIRRHIYNKLKSVAYNFVNILYTNTARAVKLKLF